MTDMTLTELAKKMKDIDFAMLFTRAADGNLGGRPMSNNGDVEFDGDAYFFSFDSAHSVSDIEREPKVALSYQGKSGLLGKPPLFVAVEGTGSIIRDKAEFAAHWVPDLERWFTDGIDTPGLALIKVSATRIHYWAGEDEGEVPVG